MIEVKAEHFQLNRNRLEEAILQQPSLYEYYASEAARVENRVARLKNELAYKTAQAKIEIRANAAAQKIKMVVDEVECAVEVNPELRAIKGQILDAEEYLGQLKAAVSAMLQKRDSIENERSLLLSKFTMLNGDCAPETSYEAQAQAVERAAAESMAK